MLTTLAVLISISTISVAYHMIFTVPDGGVRVQSMSNVISTASELPSGSELITHPASFKNKIADDLYQITCGVQRTVKARFTITARGVVRLTNLSRVC